MKHVHVILEDGEAEKLEQAKGGKTWKEYLLSLVPTMDDKEKPTV